MSPRLANRTNHCADFEAIRLIASQQECGLEAERLQADAEDRLRHGAGFRFLAEPLARLRQGGKAAHLLVQGSGSFLQVLCHRVERPGKLAKFVATPDVESLGQVAACHRLGPGDQCLDRSRQPKREQIPDEQQDKDYPGEEHGHLQCGMQPGIDHASAGEGDGEVPLGLLAEVEVGELELVVLGPDLHRPGDRPPR